jgi:hypothetical protein
MKNGETGKIVQLKAKFAKMDNVLQLVQMSALQQGKKKGDATEIMLKKEFAEITIRIHAWSGQVGQKLNIVQIIV